MNILRDKLNLHVLKSVKDTPATAIADYARRNEVDLNWNPPKGEEFGFDPLQTSIYEALVKSDEYLYGDAVLIIRDKDYEVMEVPDDDETFYCFGKALVGVEDGEGSRGVIANYGFERAYEYGSVVYFSHEGKRYVVCVQ